MGSAVARGASYASISRIFQAGLAFLLVVVLATILGPSQFGVYTITISIAAMLQYVCGHWLSSAILREADDGEQAVTQGEVDHLLLLIALATALLYAAVYFFWGERAALYTVLCWLVVAVELAFLCQTSFAAAKEEWGRFSLAYAGRGLLALLLVAGVAVYTSSAAWTLAAYGVNTGLAALICRRRLGGGSSFARLFGMFRRYAGLGLTAIIRQLYDRGDRVVVGALFGAEMAGTYGLASDLVRRPMQTLGGAMHAAFFPRLARLYDRDEEAFKVRWKANSLVVAWSAAISAVAGIVAADLLFVSLGTYSAVLLTFAVVLSISAAVETFDTFHSSYALIGARRLDRLPIVYAAAGLVFVLFAAFARFSGNALLIAWGVVAANIFGICGVVILSSRKAHKVAVTREVAYPLLYCVLSVATWFFLRDGGHLAQQIVVATALGAVGLAAAGINIYRRRASFE
ncbi:oligosaccharide flippase family protein [Pelagibacterium sp. H642]|uniref:oligosaccharide flippase family protein n=1 Tax=Pelagibacterium sp. H642 TaxID=1881069 RepID=UPI002814AD06|nr:oligosaccharide flippase family protein [Pelagibacterium sp. H642]WMT89099.1 oligosaccharide flippase family protein [Pelagibacterium sp. H642]